MAASGAGQDENLIVARVRRPHGIGGELLVAVDTDRPREVFQAGRRLRLGDGRGNPLARELTLRRMRPTTGGAILSLEGVETREAADALRGHMLLIAAADAQPAREDEVHYRDLVGLTAWSGGAEIGSVVDILETRAGLLLVVRAGGAREVLVPFAKELIDAIDLAAGELRLKLPEGLLDL
jgi:16S rRNA processing protein RimM